MSREDVAAQPGGPGGPAAGAGDRPGPGAGSGGPAAPDEVVEAQWLALVVIILGAFMAILNNSLINVALPQLANFFGASTDQIQWVLTGYTLASAMVVPLSGFLGDRFGYKKSYLISVVLFVAASFLCSVAWSTSALIGFRILQGLAGGTLMPLSMTIIYKIIPRHQIGLALGIWGIASMAAPAVGPTFGGYLIQYFSWHLLFLVNVPFGLLAALFGMILLRETPIQTDLGFDTAGFILSMVGTGTLLLALSDGQKEGWGSFYIVSLFFIAVSALSLLVWVELGTAKPLVDLRLFKNPTFTISTITSSLVMVGLFGGVFLTPLYLENIQGLSAMDTGLLLMPQALAMALMMPVSGKLFDKIGPVPLGVVGVLLLAAMTYHLHNLALDTPNSWLTWVLVLRGLGIGLSMMPLTTSGMNALPPDTIGRASGLGNMVRQISASFGIAALTTILQQRSAVQLSRISDGVTIDSVPFAQLQAQVSAGLGQAGLDPATAAGGAAAVLAGLIQKEAVTRAVADTFMVASIPLFFALPLIFFLRSRPKAQPAHTGSPAASAAPAKAEG
ncbi:DHA2 family efflux MFS transporter permease subunit [Kyrpidia tusciae]|uniref:Drug resistance transporter, EmrB/QacA subfamily n=1 Tax=Kyrpidia tusciae (strain DSM 2912 / NBRC 15312 / T2) TaxID=562970 RepID=D5WWL2_KYRT2|nr:DHA2 family efflux MFS transporter permease subunit [Kyrpidia tusciae]ADG07777.1 drug resistance transporter, EmrB/QacA subfamily [Kyrpidia tusciae DSM 2912]